MSRCFPFPPPGYEKKLSSIQEDLLAKEKHREKKRKREKKDKDRSESRDKHKEKKDKKHKDKKKAKDNDKIGSSSDQKNETKKANEIKDAIFTEELGRTRDEEQGARNHMVEKTFNIIDRKTDIYIPSTSTAVGKDACTSNNKTAANASVSMRRKIDARLPPFHQKGTNGYEIPSTIMEKEKNGSSEKIQELTCLEKRRNNNCTPPFNHKRTEGVQIFITEKQKIGDSEKRLVQPTNGRHVPPLLHKKPEFVEKQKFGGSEKKLTPPPAERSLENTQNKRAQICQKVGDFATEQRRNHVNIARPLDRSPSQKNESVLAVNPTQKATSNRNLTNPIGPFKRRNDELDNLVENVTSSVLQSTGAAQATNNERLFTNIASTEARDRSKEKKSEDAKKEGKHKDRSEKEKKRKDKDKDRHREKRKDEKKSSKSEQKHLKHDKLIEPEIKHQTDHMNGKVASSPTPSTIAGVADECNKRRRESEVNGLLCEPQLEERPNKIQRTTASSLLQLVDNGKPLESGHMASKPMSTNSVKVVRGIENNGSSINRNPNIEHQPMHMHKPPIAPPVVPPKKDRVKDRIKTRPPHPDTMYLDMIYSLPKVEEVPESDEPDWILSSKRNINRKTEANESPPKVWDKGLRIEEADVFALPYVVPF